MTSILIFVIGAVFGAALAFVVNAISRKRAEAELALKRNELEQISRAALYDFSRQSANDILTLAKEVLNTKTSENATDLESKKKLIDQSLTSIQNDLKERLEKVQTLMNDINKNVPEKYGQVSSAIQNVLSQSEILRKTTESLNIALSGSQQRGQWGERIADDILRHVGMVENINYVKQKQLDSSRSRPDFTFLLPDNLKINMDVKFPWDKYREYVNVDGEGQKESAKKIFLNSVRARIKEVTTRDYINPDENTVDYVLVFIPNEQVYVFIQESDSAILDDALKQKVILCSPLTLYAMLALIRQAIDNFNLRQSSTEIQALLAGFSAQWKKFVSTMDGMGKRLEQAREEYDQLTGTRKRTLEGQLRKIDELNKSGGIEPKLVSESDIAEIETPNETSGEIELN
jgi:DNA recombination protein RmuC